MTDQSTPENSDATPTRAVEPADQQPLAQDATSTESTPTAPTQEPQKDGRPHTRTILEIVGAAAAVVLIAAAAAGGFAAGLAVGDDGPRGLDIESMAEEWQGGGDGQGQEQRHQDRHRYGQGEMGRGSGEGDRGRGEMGRGFEGDFGQAPSQMNPQG